jgi:Leucine-rich repeat (LRR) protein
MSPKKALALALIAAALVGLAGCSTLTGETPAPEATAVATTLDQSNQNLTDADLSALSIQTQLTTLDLRGNNLSVAAVEQLKAALPNCDIAWSIPLGSTRFDSTSVSLALPADTKAEELTNLKLFPALTSVDATAINAYDALKAIQLELTNCKINWNVDVLGQSYPADTASLDLKSATISDAAALAAALSGFIKLESVDLTGQQLSAETIATLTSALSETQFLYSVDLFGKTVDAGATEADISDIDVGSVEAVSQKVALLPNLTKLVMCNCGLSDEQMEQLMAAHPTVKFVWIVKVGGWELRTNIKAFSKGNRKTFEGGEYVKGKTNFTSEDIAPLKYCTDLIALDLGHGSRIDDLSVLQYLPKLRFLILAMNRLTSIEDLKYCPDLEYLEIFQNTIGDWSPLLSLKKLTHLNCSTNYGKDEDGKRTYPDYTVLKQMPQLQRVWVIRCGLSDAQYEDLSAALPNAVINSSGTHSTSNGWRDNDLYREMQGLFNLPISD